MVTGPFRNTAPSQNELQERILMQNIIEELLVPETNKGLFYGGAFHAASQPGEIVVMNPAKGIRFTTVPDASPQDVAAAVAAASS